MAKKINNTNKHAVAPELPMPDGYVALPVVLDVYPTQQQFIDFLQNRGDQLFALSMNTYELDEMASSWYGVQAAYFWEYAQDFRNWNGTVTKFGIRYNEWSFNLWYEANVEYLESVVYPAPVYVPAPVVNKRGIFSFFTSIFNRQLVAA